MNFPKAATFFQFKRPVLKGVWLLLFLIFLNACKKGEELPNLPPDTFISVDSIALSGKDRLPTEVKLSWYGTDKDGFIKGFELSFDKINWFFTTDYDSTFKFSIVENTDTADITVYVRAIDNLGLTDPEPDRIIVPIRNTPPVVTFDEKSFPGDTVLLITTFRYGFTDVDGINTVKKAFLSVNDGAWIEIDRTKILVSVKPENPTQVGKGNALLFYDNQTSPTATKLPGFNNHGNNVFYLKVVDQSGSESTIDTSKTVFSKMKTSDLLFIGGQPAAVNDKYRSIINKVYSAGFDFIDIYKDGGKNQPRFWTPTFSLLMSSYTKVFANADQSSFTHATTGLTQTLLEFMAPPFQQFNNGGGKSFITTSFQNRADISALKGSFPLDSVSLSPGQAVISNDSTIYPLEAGYPILSPSNLLLGSDPHQPSPDAVPFYKAHITPFSGWKGPNTVGSKRIVNGKTMQVFFSVELHLFDKNPSELGKLFDSILNKDLN